MITMFGKQFDKKTVVILKFGPATDLDGMRPAEFFQVTIDPDTVSPSGEYIRFGANPGDEIVGWQKASALTIVEELGEWTGGDRPEMKVGLSNVTIRTVE